MLRHQKNKKPFVSIVIPTFNEAVNIKACLLSLMELDYPSELYEIIVVDNGSTDETQNIVRNFKVVQLHIRTDIKVGAVRNYGGKCAKGEVLAFIDGDCLAPKNWLNRALETMHEKDVKIIGGTVKIRNEPSWVERAWVLPRTLEDGPWKKLIGASIIIDREVFLNVGGFREDVNAGEDSLMANELINKGYTVFFVRDCSVIHLDYPTNLFDFAVRQYWQTSNYIESNTGVMNDYMFIGVVIYIILNISALILIPIDLNMAISVIFLSLLLPMLLTIRRAIKSSCIKVNLIYYIQMYAVDLAYVSGRSLGLIRSFLVLIDVVHNKKIYK